MATDKDIGKVELYLKPDARKPWMVVLYDNEGRQIGDTIKVAPGSPGGSIIAGLVQMLRNKQKRSNLD